MVVAGEVLQALEEPQAFVRKCKESLKKLGLLYLTTPINAPMPDCIYQFRCLAEVETLFADAELDIVSELCIPYEGHTKEDCEKNMLPINVAYLLKKSK